MWRRQAPSELILRVFLSGTSQATGGGAEGRDEGWNPVSRDAEQRAGEKVGGRV